MNENDLTLLLTRIKRQDMLSLSEELSKLRGETDITDHARDILPLAERETLTEVNVTLNGKRARIVGTRMRFPKVATLDVGTPGIEFSWETVKHIVENKGGAFKTP